MKTLLATALIASTMISANAFAQSAFLSLEGNTIITNSSGGNVKAEIVEESLGNGALTKKSVVKTSNEDFSMSLPHLTNKKLISSIDSFLGGNAVRLNGSVLSTDASNRVVFEKKFSEALISEITFPALDASSRASYSLDLKIAAETIQLKSGASGATVAPVSPRPMLSSSFRLDIDGIRSPISASRIEPFTAKQKISKAGNGSLTAGRVSYSNLVIILPEVSARDLFAWYEDFVLKGNSAEAFERNGKITMLDPSLTRELMTLEFSNMGIIGYSPLETNDAQIRKVKVELYFEKMSLR